MLGSEGTGRTRAGKAAAFTKGTEGFELVYVFIIVFMKSINKVLELAKGHVKKHPSIRQTYVYVMLNNRNGYYKIGRSKFPIKRETTLQADDPDTELVTKWKSFEIVERWLHFFFKEKQKRGEWFKLCRRDIEIIPNLIRDLNKKVKQSIRLATVEHRLKQIDRRLRIPL